MEIYLHNTLTGKKELFTPLQKGLVDMYHCGPTVYNYAHIGNLRAYVFADILRRTFEWNGYKVKQIVNITDIGHLTGEADDSGEDKMTKALLREGKALTLEAMKEIAVFYEQAFKDDLASMNILAADMFPRASEHIDEEIALTIKLHEKGCIYETSDGLYFDVSTFPQYGKLGGLTEEFKKKENARFNRIEENNEKRNPRDFAVWKKSKTPDLGWQHPLISQGAGFPGWHIECSAMSMKYLGESFDIHTGGIDHIPVHHNNEIAQSESATGKPYANYWMHGNFLNINDEKISKSLGNDLYLKNIAEKVSPLAYRYLLLTSHYSKEISFSWQSLEASQTALKKLVDTLAKMPVDGVISDDYQNKFTEFVTDDLNTSKGLALVWELLKEKDVSEADMRATILTFDKVLGLNLKHQIEVIKKDVQKEIPEAIQTLIDRRELARSEKNWSEADKLREEIKKLGFEIKD